MGVLRTAPEKAQERRNRVTIQCMLELPRIPPLSPIPLPHAQKCPHSSPFLIHFTPTPTHTLTAFYDDVEAAQPTWAATANGGSNPKTVITVALFAVS